jgi:hypothetical protein
VAGLPFLVREVERSIPGWSDLRDWNRPRKRVDGVVPLHVTTILSFFFLNVVILLKCKILYAKNLPTKKLFFKVGRLEQSSG